MEAKMHLMKKTDNVIETFETCMAWKISNVMQSTVQKISFRKERTEY
jgi:hypothetical protein